jgi:hypothetical protein
MNLVSELYPKRITNKKVDPERIVGNTLFQNEISHLAVSNSFFTRKVIIRLIIEDSTAIRIVVLSIKTLLKIRQKDATIP